MYSAYLEKNSIFSPDALSIWGTLQYGTGFHLNHQSLCKTSVQTLRENPHVTPFVQSMWTKYNLWSNAYSFVDTENKWSLQGQKGTNFDGRNCWNLSTEFWKEMQILGDVHWFRIPIVYRLFVLVQINWQILSVDQIC